MAQPGQDAKFFQRGKIEVRHADWGSMITTELLLPGISRRASSCRSKGQEIPETKNSSQKNCRKHNHGQRQYVDC